MSFHLRLMSMFVIILVVWFGTTNGYTLDKHTNTLKNSKIDIGEYYNYFNDLSYQCGKLQRAMNSFEKNPLMFFIMLNIENDRLSKIDSMEVKKEVTLEYNDATDQADNDNINSSENNSKDSKNSQITDDDIAMRSHIQVPNRTFPCPKGYRRVKDRKEIFCRKIY